MPANFENGVFGSNVPAWHGAGTVLPADTMDWETVKTHVPELGYRVEGRPLYVPQNGATSLDDWAPAARPDDIGFIAAQADDIVVRQLEQLTDFVVNVRSDGKILGVVGKGYVPVQGDDAFGFLTALLQTGEVIVHTAGTLDRGRKAWIQCLAPEPFYVAGESSEEHRGYVSFMNSFDGSTKVGAITGATRIVCQNTYNAAISGAESSYWFKHTESVMSRVAEARKALKVGQTYWSELERIANAAIRQPFSDQQFASVLDHCIPLPDGTGRKRSNAERERDIIASLWRDSATIRNVPHTAWAAVNAWTEFSDHHIRSRQTEANSLAENRLKRIWLEASVKDRAAAAIYELAGVK